MARVIVKTREILGEMIYETQYDFEQHSDFIAFEEYKTRSVEHNVGIEVQVKEKETLH